MGRLEYGWAETREEKLAVLEAFFEQKAKQFAAMGITNVFDADTSALYRALALLDGDNPSRLRLAYVKLDGAILATFSGFICHDRLSVALSSFAEGNTQRQSPGPLLLRHQIREASDARLTYYDLGVGQARQKDDWCNTVYELFESFIAFKPHGLLSSLLLARCRSPQTVDQVESLSLEPCASRAETPVQPRRIAELLRRRRCGRTIRCGAACRFPRRR